MGPDQSLELAIGNKDKVVLQQIGKIVQTKKAQICESFSKIGHLNKNEIGFLPLNSKVFHSYELNSTFVDQGHKNIYNSNVKYRTGPISLS